MTDPTAPAPTDPLDALILASADAQMCKMAVFIAKVMDAAKAQSLETSGQAIAGRIYTLCEDGRLEAQGNVRRWRAASVRAKA